MKLYKKGPVNIYQYDDGKLYIKGIDFKKYMRYKTYSSTFFKWMEKEIGLIPQRDYIMTGIPTKTMAIENLYYYSLTGARRIYEKKFKRPDQSFLSYLNNPDDFIQISTPKIKQISLQDIATAQQSVADEPEKEMTIPEFIDALQGVLEANKSQRWLIGQFNERVAAYERLIKKHENKIDRLELVVELLRDRVNALEESTEELGQKSDFLLETKVIPRDLEVYRYSTFVLAEAMKFFSESKRPHSSFINAVARHLRMIDASPNYQITEWAYKEAQEKGGGNVYLTDEAEEKVEEYLRDNFADIFKVTYYKQKGKEDEVKSFSASIGGSHYHFHPELSRDIIDHYKNKVEKQCNTEV